VISRRHLLAVLVVGSLAATLVGCSSNSESPTSPIDMSPPQAPTNLHATVDATTSREWLNWDLSASASVASYEVYVSDSPGGTGTLVASVDASSGDVEISLLPIVVETANEYYRVRAVGTNDVPSAFTSSVSVDRGVFDAPLPTGKNGKGSEGDN
jgi:hypothetical protein